jgi:hypothetical protein
MAFDTLGLQGTLDPEAVEPGLLDDAPIDAGGLRSSGARTASAADRGIVEEQRMGGLPTAPPLVQKHHGRAARHPAGRRTIARQSEQLGPRSCLLGKPR